VQAEVIFVHIVDIPNVVEVAEWSLDDAGLTFDVEADHVVSGVRTEERQDPLSLDVEVFRGRNQDDIEVFAGRREAADGKGGVRGIGSVSDD